MVWQLKRKTMFVLCYSYNTFQDCICASYLLKYPSLPSLLISKFQYFSKLLYAHLQELDGNSLRLSTNPTCPTYLQIWSMRNNGKTYGGDTGNVFISIEVYRCVCVCVCVCTNMHMCAISLSHVRLFAIPSTVAYQAPLSMGISRLVYWNGLPCSSPGGLPNPGIKPRTPTLQVNSLPPELPGKPKNTRLGSLSFLRGIFPTRESNQDLWHCRWILYQLSYLRSPEVYGCCWPNPCIILALNM